MASPQDDGDAADSDVVDADATRPGGATAYLQAVATGREALVAHDVPAVDALWGKAPNQPPTFHRLHPRRGSTCTRARRAAEYAIAALTDPARRAAADEMPLTRGLDAWLMGAFERRAGVVKGVDAIVATTPRAACDEFGALSALLARMIGDPKTPWPLLDAARVASGGMQRNGRNPERVSNAVSPKEAEEHLANRKTKGDSVEDRNAAAIAIGSTLGLPVQCVAHLRTREVTLIADKVTEKAALVLGYEVREEGGLKVRGATSAAPRETIWTAASSPSIDRDLAPWWRERRDNDQEFLFPKVLGTGKKKYMDGTEPVPPTELQAAVKKIKPEASWHSFRFGVARALLGVHKVPGGPKTPVALETRNTLQFRSNRKLLGSSDSYILDLVDPLLEATRALHKVDLKSFGGLVSCADAASAAVGVAPGDAPFDGFCGRCEAILDAKTFAYICEHVLCTWAVCTSCIDASEKEKPLWCAAHDPTNKKKNPKTKKK